MVGHIVAHDLRIEILRKYETQGDFASSIGLHESMVSQVLRGRRKLTRTQAKRWVKALRCDPKLLSAVLKED